ncbi:cation-translocating P-type ATPase [Streptomyces sp. NPDC054866]
MRLPRRLSVRLPPASVAGVGHTLHGSLRAAVQAVPRGGAAVAEFGGAAVRLLAAASPQRLGSLLADAPHHLKSIATELADSGDVHIARQVWSHDGHAHLQMRGLTGRGTAHRTIAKAAIVALMETDGVYWAEANAETRRLLVIFNENRVDVGLIEEVIESVEAAHGVADEAFPAAPQEHPADNIEQTAAYVALSAGLVGLGISAAGRLVRVPPLLPYGVRECLVLSEAHLRLRHIVEERLGRIRGDLLLSLAITTAHTLTHNAAPIAVDVLRRSAQIVEAHARRAAWARHETDLHSIQSVLPHECVKRPARPEPLPPGPVETVTDRAALGSMAGAGALLLGTRSPFRATELLMTTAPPAAWLGREGYAAVLDWRLARRGVLPMNAAVLRRLDRVDTVIIDSVVLCGSRPVLLSAQATRTDLDDTEVWQTAQAVLGAKDVTTLQEQRRWSRRGWTLEREDPHARPLLDGSGTVAFRLRDSQDRHCGTVTIGCGLDPLAEAVLEAARSNVDRVVVTEHAGIGELLPLVDEVLPPGDLSDHVRRLQTEGRVVMVIAAGQDTALALADVGVSVLHGSHGASWSADLICAYELDSAWLLLRTLGPAGRVSRRSAKTAMGGAAMGALLTLVDASPQHQRRKLSPMHSSAAFALLGGVVSARRVGTLPSPKPALRGSWHSLTARATFLRVREYAASHPTADGKTGAAHPRTRAESLSRLLPPKAVALTRAVAEELRDPLTPVLAFGAAASAVVGSRVDALLVGGVMLGSALVSGSQRMKAEQALNELLDVERVTVRRARLTTIPRDRGWAMALAGEPFETVTADRLAVGDVMLLGPSDVVPADARLLSATELEVDESSLTGEPLPVDKDPAPTPGAALADRSCMVYEGTTVVAGHGCAVVTAVGASTEAGRASAVSGRAAPATGVQARLADLTRITLPATAAAGAVVTGLALLRGTPLRQALGSGVSIAVAAVPEGLPLVATAAQLSAARRLGSQEVLVRSARALEALGRVDTVAFDKTGTLTAGRLSVTRLADYGGEVAFDTAHARRLLRVSGRACPQADPDTPQAVPHATDRAVIEAVHDHSEPDTAWQLIRELPFETNRGYAAALGTNDSQLHLEVKGAPEVVLARCATVWKAGRKTVALTAARRRRAQRTVRRLAAAGLRVLAVAERVPSVDRTHDGDDLAALTDDLTLIGFLAFADAPRRTTADTVRRLTEAGTRAVMITGDHPVTATALAAQLGLPASESVLTGAELDTLPKRDRDRRIAQTSVFARVSPEHKTRIVEALQRSGHVVAMTGDGTNDAPAIRLADVGIAIAGRGSTAARRAADLVLTQADPSRIATAMSEGRALWGRVRDSVSILVGGNAGEVAFTILGTAVDGRSPLSTRQLLLVNMLTDMLPALAVALAPSTPPPGDQVGHATDSEAQASAPDQPDQDEPIEDERTQDPLSSGPVTTVWGSSLAHTLAVRSGATTLGATLAWGAGKATGRVHEASTMGLVALIGTQLGQTLMMGRHSRLVTLTSGVSGLALLAGVQTPTISRFFGCRPLRVGSWAVAVGSCAAATAVAMTAGTHWAGRTDEESSERSESSKPGDAGDSRYTRDTGDTEASRER